MSRVPTTPSPASPFSRVQPKSFRAPGDQPFRATDLFLPRRPAVPARNKVSRPCPTHESSFAQSFAPYQDLQPRRSSSNHKTFSPLRVRPSIQATLPTKTFCSANTDPRPAGKSSPQARVRAVRCLPCITAATAKSVNEESCAPPRDTLPSRAPFASTPSTSAPCQNLFYPGPLPNLPARFQTHSATPKESPPHSTEI